MYYERRRPQSFQRKRFHFNRRFFFFTALGVLFIALVFVFLFLFTNLFGNKNTITPLNITAGSQVCASSDTIYSLSGSTVTARNFSGTEKWSVPFSSSDLKLINSDTLVCVYNASSAIVLGADKTHMFSVDAVDVTIERAVCGKEHLALLVKSTTTEDETEVSTYYIRIFDQQGTELDREEITNGTLLKFGFYGDADNLWFLTVDTSGVSPISRITTINPTQKTTTGRVELNGQLVTDVFYPDNELCYLSGTTNLSYYDLFNTKQGDILIYGLECVDTTYNGNEFLLLYVPRNASEEGYTSLRILSIDSTDTTLQLPDDIFSVVGSGDEIYCFSKNQAIVFKVTGEYVSTIPFETPISNVQKLSDSQVLITTSQGLSLMSIG